EKRFRLLASLGVLGVFRPHGCNPSCWWSAVARDDSRRWREKRGAAHLVRELTLRRRVQVAQRPTVTRHLDDQRVTVVSGSRRDRQLPRGDDRGRLQGRAARGPVRTRATNASQRDRAGTVARAIRQSQSVAARWLCDRGAARRPTYAWIGVAGSKDQRRARLHSRASQPTDWR